ncbi:MAG TPA: hypothetical protein VJZ32_03585 [Candidatus Bathyarchaeia archaeon]|nr:hypothetical protein [Candidatus Bathyarchaeia archaeon]
MAPSQTLIKASSVLGVTLVVFLLDWFYLIYVTLHGFQTKTQEIALGTMNLSIPLGWLPIVGVVLVSLVLWYEESARIFPKRGGPQIDTLANLRLLRVIAFSLAVFVFILYIPNVIGSNWFWGVMSSSSQLHGIALSLLSTEQSYLSLNPIWVYSLSQVLASAAMVVSAWILGGLGSRRPRR